MTDLPISDNDIIIPGYQGRIRTYKSKSITYDVLYYVLANIPQIPRCKWVILNHKYKLLSGYNGKIIACRKCLNIFYIIDDHQDINNVNFICDCIVFENNR